MRRCQIEGCDKPARARGMCPMHWRRWRLYGDPRFVKQIRGNDEARFWSKVRKTDGCWLWMGNLDKDGYGEFRTPRSHRKAHIVAYEMVFGPVPEGLQLDHLCRTRHCVNPAHLEPVTPRENTLRGNGPSAQNARKTHCPRGHPYDETNTVYRNGRRHCAACERERGRQRREAAS